MKRKIILAISTAAMVLTTSMALPYASAEARRHDRYRYGDRHDRYDDGNYRYGGRRNRYDDRNYRYSEWRGRDGRYYCRRPDGTVGTIIGGVAGALVGRTIDTRGDRATGTVLGAAGGALLGNQVAKGGRRRCR